MDLKYAHNLLVTDPRTLLDNAYVQLVGGGANSTSNIAIFTISKPLGLQGMWKKYGSNQIIPSFSIRLKQGVSVDKSVGTENGEEYRTFAAFYVAMKKMQSSGITGPVGTVIALPSAGGGSDICITSQLTGCSFGIGSQVPGGCCLVSHIQPLKSAAADQVEINNQTRDLIGYDEKRIVGKGSGYTERASIIGKRTFGVWEFYMQKAKGTTKEIDQVEDL